MDNPISVSILLRFQRLVPHETYVAVPVTEDVVLADGTPDFEKLVARGAAMARSARWAQEPGVEVPVKVHPVQQPMPEGWKP